MSAADETRGNGRDGGPKWALIAALATGILAAILGPPIAQDLHDRPREQQLRASLIQDMARATALAVNRGKALCENDLVLAGFPGNPGFASLSAINSAGAIIIR